MNQLQRLGWYGLLAVLLVSLLPLTSLSARAQEGIDRAALLHDSLDDLYRTPLGPVPTESQVTLRFRAAAGNLETVTLRVWDALAEQQQMIPMQVITTTPEGYDLWETVLDVGRTPTLYWYRFIVSGGGETLYYEDDSRPGDGAYFPANESGPGAVYAESPDLSYQLTVYDPDYYTPEWMRNAVIYQIFPDRFRNSDPSNDPDESVVFYDSQHAIVHDTWNEPPLDPRQPGPFQNQWNVDFFGGDLAGIIERLDYLHDLGVTAIYLNPIFEARSNHRYDTADYKVIDPFLVGDMDDFRTLVSEAGQRGMVVILDGVFNHLSSDSVFFDRYHRYEDDGACESEDSQWRNWFLFVPPKGQQPAACVDTSTGSTFYVSWAGVDTIPKINSERPEARLYFFTGRNSVARLWGVEGIGGWRLDVANEIDPGGPSNDYWEGFRSAVRGANPEGVVIGEEWGNATRWLLGDEWDSVMNYRLRRGILGFVIDEDFTDNDAHSDNVIHALTPSQVDRLIRDIASDYPPMATYAMMNILDSHDTSRLPFVAGDTEGQKLAALLQFVLPGAPTIYYGDEIAIDAPSVPDTGGVLQDDPHNRAPYPWPDAEGDYYAPPDKRMFAFYQQLSALRHANPALRQGDMITLLTDDATGVYAFLRIDAEAGNAALVVLNNGDSGQEVSLNLAGLLPGGLSLIPAFADPVADQVEVAALVTVTVGPNSGNVWTVTAEESFSAPEPPTAFTAQGQTGAAVLSWEPDQTAAGYIIYRSPVAEGGFEPLTPGPVPAPSYVDAAVTNGFKYYYKIASVGADGLVGALSASVLAIPSAQTAAMYYRMDETPESVTLAYGATITIQAAIRIEGATEAEGAAQGVRTEAALVPVDGDMTTADWLPMTYTGEDEGADVYTATIPLAAAGEYQLLARFSTNAAESWTVTTYEDSTVPLLTVAAPDDTTVPAAPPSAQVAEAALSGVVVEWEASPADDVIVYRVFRSGEGEDKRLLAEVPADGETIYVDKAIAQGSIYSYTITAVDGSLNESDPATTQEARVERRGIPVTFNVTVPDYTQEGEGDVYLAGDLGTENLPFWDPAGIVMQQVDDTHWTVTVEIPEGAKIQYKYARGTWLAVEKGSECEEIANRLLTVELAPGQDSLSTDDLIAKWRDLDECG